MKPDQPPKLRIEVDQTELGEVMMLCGAMLQYMEMKANTHSEKEHVKEVEQRMERIFKIKRIKT